ncbi:MAG TPA: protein kinase [Edaphobacter sp.]
MALEPGKRVGDYEVVELLGTGGMGHVYRARNIISNRTEALKILLPELSADREFADRFIAEIRTLASLDHPNIASLHTAFQTDDQLVMVMEYVKGHTLEQRAYLSPMTTSTVVEYITQVLSALTYAHARSVIHRDIKPANLMVTSDGVVKLMDFGIAKSQVDINLTRTGTTIGSFYYMSPEQVNGAKADARSDLYSTGIVLYELLAGRRPFESDSTYGVLDKQLHSAPQPPIELNSTLPPQLNAIILKALAKDRAERFQTAAAFRDALKPFCSEILSAPAPVSSTTAAPPPPPPTPPPGYPAFQPVVVPQQPATAYPNAPLPRSTTGKPLWIATGALAAVLALICVAIAVPRLLRTHASEAPTASPSAQPAPAPSTQQESTTPAPSAADQPTASDLTVHQQPQPPRAPYQGAMSQNGITPIHSIDSQSTPPISTGPSEAELEQLHERLIQLDARAKTVDRAISQIRRLQEADGLGLRNDMETADAKLNSYLQSATQDLQLSRAASAQLELDKAEIEIGTLEKFLGR